VLVLRPIDSNKAMLMISALPTIASPIVRVIPKAPIVLAPPEENLVLFGEDLEALKDRYAAKDVYRFESLLEALPTWTSTTSALEAKDPSQRLECEWSVIDPKSPPLETHEFSADVSASVTTAQLVALGTDCLKAGAGGDDIVSLCTGHEQLMFQINPAATWECKAALKLQTPFVSNFRLADLTQVVDALIQEGASQVDISADSAGPLRFAWDDRHATWEVYLPQVMDGGSRDPRKMRAMF
jgi:hypothetical protein